MSANPPVSAGALLKHPPFLFFLLSRSLSRFSSQIAAVAIGWQIYDLTGSALALGMVGLVQFLPTALLVFVAGHAADRFERKRVIQICQFAEAATALYLAGSTYFGAVGEVQIFVATFMLGIVGGFESPTTAALLPLVAPQGSLQRATPKRWRAGRDHHGACARRLRLCVRAALRLWRNGAVLDSRDDPDRLHPAGPAGDRQKYDRR
jgi:hypothetical protein